MYNVHPYFSLKNLGKKNVCITHGKIQVLLSVCRSVSLFKRVFNVANYFSINFFVNISNFTILGKNPTYFQGFLH